MWNALKAAFGVAWEMTFDWLLPAWIGGRIDRWADRRPEDRAGDR